MGEGGGEGEEEHSFDHFFQFLNPKTKSPKMTSAPAEIFQGWIKSNISGHCDPCGTSPNGCYHPTGLFEPILCPSFTIPESPWPLFLILLPLFALILVLFLTVSTLYIATHCRRGQHFRSRERVWAPEVHVDEHGALCTAV